jgi:hypothetical protein
MIKFKRGSMVRNNSNGKLFYILDTPQRCRIAMGNLPAYAISHYINRSLPVPENSDLTIYIYEQVMAEQLFVVVL